MCGAEIVRKNITGIEAYSSYEMDDYSDSAYLYGICVN